MSAANRDLSVLSWRDWALFGLKWLLLVLFSAVVYFNNVENAARDPMNGIALAFAIGAVVNFLLAVFILSPRLSNFMPPMVVLADIATAIAFIRLAPNEPLLILGIAGALVVSGILRLNPVWGFLHVIGILAATTIILISAIGMGELGRRLTEDYAVPALILVMLAAVALISDYVLDRQIAGQAKRLVELSKGETAQLNAMRERMRTIYGMSSDLSSTLDYDDILAAALNAGRLGLRDEHQGSYAAAVLVFRGEDTALHIAASRGLNRIDESVSVPGINGIIGHALREAVPVFHNGPTRDPEVGYFSGFQFARSLVCVPLRAGFDNYGVILYGSDIPDSFDPEHGDLLSAIGHQATIALQNAVLYRSLLEEKERIVSVEEEARKQLARDLHDGPTQSVAAIAMRMAYIQKLLERDPSQVSGELQKVEDLARKTVKEIRHMLFTLRPLVLESQGLGAALQQLAQNMQETHGQAVAIKLARGIESILDTHQQGVLFYIAEEAVNNARKHAQASLITVAIGSQNDTGICRISDNGVGFDLGAVDSNYERRGSLGMVNMRERAALLDGTLRIDSAVGRGTTITIAFPLRQSRPSGVVSNGKAGRSGSKLLASMSSTRSKVRNR